MQSLIPVGKELKKCLKKQTSFANLSAENTAGEQFEFRYADLVHNKQWKFQVNPAVFWFLTGYRL
jgi:hypothetical protein